MKAIINYNEKFGEKSSIEFDNLEDAYNFTFNSECNYIEIIGAGIYAIDEFQIAYSNNEFID